MTAKELPTSKASYYADTLIWAIPLLGTLLFFVVPAIAALSGIAYSGQETIPNQTLLRAVAFRSFTIAALSSAATTVIAVTFCLSLTFLRETTQRTFVIICMAPITVHLVLRAHGLEVILGRGGVVNALFTWSGITTAPLDLVFSRTGTIIGLVSWLLPLAIFYMHVAIRGIPQNLLDAAKCLGASRGSTCIRLVAPMCAPQIIVLLGLTFCLSMGAFITPRLLGGLDDYTLVMLVADLLQEGRRPEAAAVGVFAVVVPLAVFLGTWLVASLVKRRMA